MRLLLITIIALLSRAMPAEARMYQFIYVAQTEDMESDVVARRLRQAFDDAKSYDQNLIIYMANGGKPLVVEVMGEAALANEQVEDSVNNAFIEILSEMGEHAQHIINGSTEVDNILKMLHGNDFVDSQGNPAYDRILFDFYCAPSFWASGYNDVIIADLYFTLNMRQYIEDPDVDFNFRILTPKSQELNSRSKRKELFGRHNINDINNSLTFMEL